MRTISGKSRKGKKRVRTVKYTPAGSRMSTSSETPRLLPPGSGMWNRSPHKKLWIAVKTAMEKIPFECGPGAVCRAFYQYTRPPAAFASLWRKKALPRLEGPFSFRLCPETLFQRPVFAQEIGRAHV